MSLERALVTQAGPYMLAAKANTLMAVEVRKGCQGEVLANPVALEPVFHPLAGSKDILALRDEPSWICQEPPDPDDLIRFRIWLSPEQPFSWDGHELFLKQLSSVSNRVGLEIVGNQGEITISLLCHRDDVPVVTIAFLSGLRLCRLTQTDRGPADETVSWNDVVLRDYFPSPPYCHLLTRPNAPK
jgi:hypothetical protein